MSSAWLGDASDEETDKSFQVNQEFAARLEHNKRREEVHRLEAKLAARQPRAPLKRKANAELEPEELSESSSDDDEEDDWVEDEAEQRKLLETIARIRKKDSTIYDPASKLHPDDSEEENEDADAVPAPKPKRQKAMRLAEVNMREALAGPDGEERGRREPLPGTYQGELQSLKNQFLQAAGDEEGPSNSSMPGDDLLEKRALPSDASVAAAAASRPKAAGTGSLEATDPEDAYLQRFILTQGWRDQEDGGAPAYDQLLKDVDEEEEQLQREEQYEASYNFRFEEPGAKQVITFPRQLGNSLRKPDERRKKQRESHAQNKTAAKQEAEAEVKRLKNLKKQQLQESLQQLQDAVGGAGPSEDVLSKLLAADFDPDDYDKLMSEAFNEEYYEAEGDDDLPDDVVGDEPALEEGDEPETFKAARARIQQGLSVGGQEEAAADRDTVMRLLDEYQSLDFEDKIGDVVCRFKYRSVPSIDTGLQADQILGTSDKDLNQVLGMRRLAAYRDDRRNMRPNFQKINEIRRQKGSAPEGSKSRKAPHDKPKRQKPNDVLDGRETQQPNQKKKRRQGHEAVEADPAAQRMQSYAKLTLKRSSDGKSKVTKQHAPAVPSKGPADAGGQQLTRAQKRNKRRAAIRAAQAKPA